MKRMNAANDPSTDPIVAFATRYTLPVTLVGILAVVGFVSRLLSQ